MKKSSKIILIGIAFIIIISNIPPFAFFFQESYAYQNRDGSFKFTEEPMAGLDFEVAKIRFQRFKKENPENPNKNLYRTFAIKPYRFWEWWQFFAHGDRFKLKYLEIVS